MDAMNTVQQNVHDNNANPAPCKVFRAQYRGVIGEALCNTARQVFFASDATGVWQALTDADAPWLTLGDRLDHFTEALIRNANLVQCADAKNMYSDCSAAVEADAQRRAARAAARMRRAA
jgi:hypothetical protein